MFTSVDGVAMLMTKWSDAIFQDPGWIAARIVDGLPDSSIQIEWPESPVIGRSTGANILLAQS